MYPQISWELVADPLGSAEHTLGTTVTAWSSHTVLIHQQNHTFIDTTHASFDIPLLGFSRYV